MDGELISSQVYQVRDSVARQPTITDVARAAGVSVGTVSNVLNSKGRHSDSTRARVMHAASSMHYRPNALIRSLQTGRTNTVGVFTWRVYTDYLGAWRDMTLDLLRGISEGLATSARDVLLYARHPHEGGVEPAYFLDGRVDAIILAPGGLSADGLAQLAATGLPVVTLYQTSVPDAVASVRIDNVAGVRAAVDHLVGLGHTRIAFVSPGYNDDFRERRQAYVDAMAEHGLSPSPEWAGCGTMQRETDVGGVIEQMAISPDLPTALICGNDGVATEAVQQLRKRGIEVPQDISVCGFDDSPSARSSDLTSIRQPAEDVGATAARFVESLLTGAQGHECRAVLPVRLISRSSTGTPRERRGNHRDATRQMGPMGG